MLPLMSSHSEQRVVLLFIFYGQKDLMQMRFTLRCVQCMATSVLWDQQDTFGVHSLLTACWHVVAMTVAMVAAVDAFVDWWDKCVNDLGQYVEKLNANV